MVLCEKYQFSPRKTKKTKKTNPWQPSGHQLQIQEKLVLLKQNQCFRSQKNPKKQKKQFPDDSWAPLPSQDSSGNVFFVFFFTTETLVLLK